MSSLSVHFESVGLSVCRSVESVTSVTNVSPRCPVWSEGSLSAAVLGEELTPHRPGMDSVMTDGGARCQPGYERPSHCVRCAAPCGLGRGGCGRENVTVGAVWLKTQSGLNYVPLC